MQFAVTQNKRNDIDKTGGFLIALGDIFAIISSYVVAMKLEEHWPSSRIFFLDFNSPSPDLERYYIYALIAVANLLFFMNHGHYTQRIPWWTQVRLILLSAFVSALAEGFIDFMTGIGTSRMVVLLNWGICFFFFVFLRLVFFRVRASTTHWNAATTLIGDSATLTDILYALNADPGTGYDINNVLIRDDKGTLETGDLPRRYANLQINSADNVETFIDSHPDHFYIFVPDAFRSARRDEIVDKLNTAQARYAIAPSTSKLGLYEMEPRYFFGFDVMIMMVKSSLSHPVSRFWKRSIDIVLSGSALLFAAPLFVFIIAALKLERHEGSIFYGGERIGKDGELFKCWKFRTMRPNSDHLLREYLDNNPEAREHWEKYFKLPKDPRVNTHTAYFLRKSSLDEIPQLFNVLKGDMSLVGPRPILPNEAEPYGEALPEYIKIRPGITGLWQVSGRNAASFQRRIYWDCWYVRNWSIWGDIVIMLKTIPAVLIRNDGH